MKRKYRTGKDTPYFVKKINQHRTERRELKLWTWIKREKIPLRSCCGVLPVVKTGRRYHPLVECPICHAYAFARTPRGAKLRWNHMIM